MKLISNLQYKHLSFFIYLLNVKKNNTPKIILYLNILFINTTTTEELNISIQKHFNLPNNL